MRTGDNWLDRFGRGLGPSALVVAAVLIALANAGLASGNTLPTSGLAPCNCTANIDKASICAHKAGFKFSGHCDCATSFDFTANGAWTKDDTGPGGSAAEALHLSNGQQASISAHCPADPWLYNVNCSPVNISPGSFINTWQITQMPTRPFTAGAVSDAQKQAYQPQEQNQCPLPVHFPPRVVSPTPNQVFSGPAHQVLVNFKEMDTDPAFSWANDFTSSWKFQVEAGRTDFHFQSAAIKSKAMTTTGGAPIVTPVSAGAMHPGQATAAAPLIPPVMCGSGQYGSATVTLEPGKYHLRARVWSPKQHDGGWSQWVNFEVK